jgi:hypothetical protein
MTRNCHWPTSLRAATPRGLPGFPPGSDRIVATRAQVVELLDLGHSYETAGRELHISPGLAFMIVTGLPADGSDAPTQQELAEKRVLPGSSQHLVNPPPFNPTRKAHVMEWVKARAARELTHSGDEG